MLIYPASRYVIDITGGKKSMVASASIFGRNYNCDVVYVDYDQYIPDLRRPMPGTEKLNIVYSVQRDFIKLLDVEELKKIQSKRIAPSIRKRLHDDVLHISKKPLRGELNGFLSICQAEASCISPKEY